MEEVTYKEFCLFKDATDKKFNYRKYDYIYQKDDNSIICFIDGICLSKFFRTELLYFVNRGVL